jgi:hypothetical protein
MPDLVEITTGANLDSPKVADQSPVLALTNAVPAPVAAAPAATLSFLDKAKGLFGSASSNVSSAASSANARVAAATNDNAGLMWIILAAMVAAGFFIFSGGAKKGKKSFFKLGSRKPSGGSFAR